MKKITVPTDKKFGACINKGFDHKDTIGMNLEWIIKFRKTSIRRAK